MPGPQLIAGREPTYLDFFNSPQFEFKNYWEMCEAFLKRHRDLWEGTSYRYGKQTQRDEEARTRLNQDRREALAVRVENEGVHAGNIDSINADYQDVVTRRMSRYRDMAVIGCRPCPRVGRNAENNVTDRQQSEGRTASQLTWRASSGFWVCPGCFEECSKHSGTTIRWHKENCV